MFDGSRHEPFCTVLLEQVSESISSFKRAVYRPNQTAHLPLETGPSQCTGCIRVTLPVMFISQDPQPTVRMAFVRAARVVSPRRHRNTPGSGALDWIAGVQIEEKECF